MVGCSVGRRVLNLSGATEALAAKRPDAIASYCVDPTTVASHIYIYIYICDWWLFLGAVPLLLPCIIKVSQPTCRVREVAVEQGLPTMSGISLN